MIRSNLTAISRRAALAALLVVSGASVACASTGATQGRTPPRDPKQWSAVSCATCTQTGVEVSVRNSIDDKGKAGRHMVARVRNLNAHAVVLVLEVVPDQLLPMDDTLPLSERWRVMLHPAGAAQDETTVLFHARDVANVTVHSVEKF
jgi:hypothetical protein